MTKDEQDRFDDICACLEAYQGWTDELCDEIIRYRCLVKRYKKYIESKEREDDI